MEKSAEPRPTEAEQKLAEEIMQTYASQGWTQAYALARRLIRMGYALSPRDNVSVPLVRTPLLDRRQVRRANRVPGYEGLTKHLPPEEKAKIDDTIKKLGDLVKSGVLREHSFELASPYGRVTLLHDGPGRMKTLIPASPKGIKSDRSGG